jgi:hypothetical protein
MKVTDWTRKLAVTIAAESGNGKTLKRLMAGAVVGGSMALAAGPAKAQTNHAIQDPSFDEIDLTVAGQAGGTGHWDYLSNLNLFHDYPWVAAGGNANSWLYNTDYSVGFSEVPTPRSPNNAAHLADGNIFQIIDGPFISGRQYTLSAWVHYDTDSFIGDDFGLRLFDGSLDTFNGAEIFHSQNYFLGVDFFDDGNWHEVILSFTAGANADGKPIGIYLGPEAQANRLTVDDVSLTSIPGILLPGDYNDDNLVDAADYVVWRKNQGTMNTLPNDPHGGTIDADQYNTWQTNFGDSPGAGAAAAQELFAAALPEPSTCYLAGAAAAGVLSLRRRLTNSWTATR